MAHFKKLDRKRDRCTSRKKNKERRIATWYSTN